MTILFFSTAYNVLQGGVVLKVGVPIEKHAAKIYTRTMFEKFQDILYASGSYDIDEIIAGKSYIAKHCDSATREKWCKVSYCITLEDGHYSCECGMYEHMGMLCSHVLQVIPILIIDVCMSTICLL